MFEQPALALLAELGWQIACGLDETFAHGGGSLGRRDRSEVVLLPRLRAALQRLNLDQPPDEIGAAIKEISRNRSAMGPVAANREVYRLLKDGVLVSVPDRERGGQSKVRPHYRQGCPPQSAVGTHANYPERSHGRPE